VKRADLFCVGGLWVFYIRWDWWVVRLFGLGFIWFGVVCEMCRDVGSVVV
jgi:hypothetical protein